MTQVQAPSAAESLDDRMRSVAEAVRRELLALVDEVAGKNVRPTSLSRILGIDKNLANRLVRAIRAEDALDMLVLAPSPHGLRIFVDAVDRAADAPARCEAARRSIEQVQLLNDEFTGGRAALVAAIGAGRPSGPHLHVRAERPVPIRSRHPRPVPSHRSMSKQAGRRSG